MARAARNKSVSALHVLLLLLACAQAAGRNAPTVCYKFTISPKEAPWCELEGQVNGSTFLWYNCSQKAKCDCHFLSLTKQHETCNGEEKTLKDLTEEFRKIPPDETASHTLKVEMTCQLEDNGRAFLHIVGIKALHVDSENGTVTPLNSKGTLSLDELENDQDMKEILLKNSPEMCEEWYEKVRNHQNNASNTTAPVTSEPTTEPPTSASATDQSKNVNIVNIVCIIVGILISLIIPRSCVFDICRKRRRRQPAGQEAPSGDCVGQDEEASFLQKPEIPGEPSCSQSRDSQLPADWGERSTERLCLEQRPVTQTGSAVSCISLSDSEF